MSQLKVRSSFAYRRIKPDLLTNFAVGVRDGIFNNPTIYTMPPISIATLQGLIDAYTNARAAYKQGGLAQKGDYELAKKALTDALDQLALYVNGVALGNAALITEAGFVPTKGNLTPITKPNQPTGVTLTRGLPGELYADCDAAAGVDSTGAILIADVELPEGMGINELGQIVVTDMGSSDPGSGSGPTPGPGSIRIIQDLNKARRKKFTGLQIGTTYYLYMWAMNAGGVSPLSAVVSKKVVEG